MTKYLLPISILIGAFFIGAAGLKIAHNHKWSTICTPDGLGMAGRSMAEILDEYNLVTVSDYLYKSCVDYYYDNSLLPQNYLK